MDSYGSYWWLYVRTDIGHPGVAKLVSVVQPPVSGGVAETSETGRIGASHMRCSRATNPTNGHIDTEFRDNGYVSLLM